MTGPTRSLRLDADRSVVALLDMQERLMPAVSDDAAVRQRARLLVFGADQCGVPIVGTEMNPSKLGPLVDAMPQACAQVLPKMTFGAAETGLGGLLRSVAPQADQVLLMGVETHVAVSQTAFGLMEEGWQVWVASDCCGSRDARDHHAALARMAQEGVRIATSEMAIFEWMRTCEHPNFRSLSRHIKEPRFPSAE